MLKNIDKQKVLKLKEAVTYQKGQVVFLILTQNEALSVTLFLLIKCINFVFFIDTYVTSWFIV